MKTLSVLMVSFALNCPLFTEACYYNGELARIINNIEANPKEIAISDSKVFNERVVEVYLTFKGIQGRYVGSALFDDHTCQAISSDIRKVNKIELN